MAIAFYAEGGKSSFAGFFCGCHEMKARCLAEAYLKEKGGFQEEVALWQTGCSRRHLREDKHGTINGH
jgi:hypothetical protein